MREIKFRGKCIVTNKWKYGYYWKQDDLTNAVTTHHILTEKFPQTNSQVLLESVGQFTGLHDKKGKEIYEGDFVKHDAWDYPFEVVFNQEKARFTCKMMGGLSHFIDNNSMEVIGNIFENPKLLNK